MSSTATKKEIDPCRGVAAISGGSKVALTVRVVVGDGEEQRRSKILRV